MNKPLRILHTADWHLGKRLENISRMDEQREVLEEICSIADQQEVDAVVVAGDLFDTFNPPSEALELFYKTLKKLANNGQRPVIAIAGNHDSPDRIEAPDPLARECGILFAGYPYSQIPTLGLDSGLHVSISEPGFIEIRLPDKNRPPLRLLLTPYANEYRLKTFLGTENSETELRNQLASHWQRLADTYCDNQGVNILVTHLFFMKNGGERPEEPDDEKPILHVGGAQAIYSENVPKQIQYTALGHLHRYQIIDNQPCPIVYSSSPLGYSFSEAHQTKYVVIIEAEPGKEVVFNNIALEQGKKLHRKRFEDMDQAVLWLEENPYTLVELTIVADDYLASADRKRLQNAHDGIVTIIPEIKNKSNVQQPESNIDLTLEMDDMFKQYFQYKTGQVPNEELMDLFQEIKAINSEDS